MSRVYDKVILMVSPFMFASAIIIAKVALNDGLYVYTFNMIRNSLAFLLTYFVRSKNCRNCCQDTLLYDQKLLFWSGLCGVANALGMTCSAVALANLNTALFSFLLGLLVVITPLLSHFLPYKTIKLQTTGWLAVCLSIVGTFVLQGCVSNMRVCILSGNWYSVVAIGAAFFYSLYSYLIDLGSDQVDSSALTQGALLVSCFMLAIFLILNCVFSGVSVSDKIHTTFWQLICVFGVGAVEAVAWQCETYAVTTIGSSKAAMIIATEAPITTLLASIILHESLSHDEYVGCLMMFLAAVLASCGTGTSEIDHGFKLEESTELLPDKRYYQGMESVCIQ